MVAALPIPPVVDMTRGKSSMFHLACSLLIMSPFLLFMSPAYRCKKTLAIRFGTGGEHPHINICLLSPKTVHSNIKEKTLPSLVHSADAGIVTGVETYSNKRRQENARTPPGSDTSLTFLRQYSSSECR